MRESDLIWLAGLLEGEGTFDLHKQKYPRIRVGMADRDVVGRAATLMGSSIRMSISTVGNKAMFHAELSGAKAAEIMWLLLPHMGTRRSAKIGEILGRYEWLSGRPQIAGSTTLPGPALTRIPGIPKSA